METCPTCHSTGFPKSILGDHRCEFCDGTEGGHPPTLADIKPYSINQRTLMFQYMVASCPQFREDLISGKITNDLLLLWGITVTRTKENQVIFTAH